MRRWLWSVAEETEGFSLPPLHQLASARIHLPIGSADREET